MQINYLGRSCFKIKTQNTILVTDPFNKYIGFSMPLTKADIVTISHEHKDNNCLKKIEGNPFIVNAPGEYEIADVSIFGFKTFHDKTKGEKQGKNTIYTIRTEEISLCHLGDLSHKLSDNQLEEVNGTDILFIPVGGISTIGPKEAVEVVNQVEPKIIIPMHYCTPDHDKIKFKEMAVLNDFLEEIGALQAKKENKLLISKLSLPQETEVICLMKK